MKSRSGTKLYAVRDESGKFEDVQTYKRAHTADMRQQSKAEADAAKGPTESKVRKAAKNAVESVKKSVRGAVAAVKGAAKRAVGKGSSAQTRGEKDGRECRREDNPKASGEKDRQESIQEAGHKKDLNSNRAKSSVGLQFALASDSLDKKENLDAYGAGYCNADVYLRFLDSHGCEPA
jgi:hypothetical protein